MSKIKQINVEGTTYDLGIKEVVQIADDGFYLTDINDNVALKYDGNGLDAAKVSEHLKSLLMSSGENPGINYDIVSEI